MKKDVLISIKGVSNIDGDKDVIELQTVGNMFTKDGKHILMYKESEATGFTPNTTTLVEVDGEKCVTMRRRGDNASQLIIEKGKRHLCHYDTGEGNLMIGIFSEYIHSNLGDEGGNLSFKYSLDINSNLASENEVFITVKSLPQS